MNSLNKLVIFLVFLSVSAVGVGVQPQDGVVDSQDPPATACPLINSSQKSPSGLLLGETHAVPMGDPLSSDLELTQHQESLEQESLETDEQKKDQLNLGLSNQEGLETKS
ncbi:MAG: hypothetical protein MPJ24_02330 [Pirellulaceae bacterium]|nr:hypothetical protein [Pirellulaceae bacterium]